MGVTGEEKGFLIFFPVSSLCLFLKTVGRFLTIKMAPNSEGGGGGSMASVRSAAAAGSALSVRSNAASAAGSQVSVKSAAAASQKGSQISVRSTASSKKGSQVSLRSTASGKSVAAAPPAKQPEQPKKLNVFTRFTKGISMCEYTQP